MDWKRISVLSPSFLIILAGTAVSPALAEISAAFPDASRTLVRMVSSVPPLLVIVGTLTSGQLVRYISKRRLMVLGLVIYVLGGISGGLAGSMLVLLGARAALGLGAGVIRPLITALVAQFYTGEERSDMLGYSSATRSLGSIVGALVGGAAASLSWRYAFGTYLMAVPVLLLVLLALPQPESDNGPLEKGARLPLSIYGLAGASFALMVAFFVLPTNVALFMSEENLGRSGLVGVARATLSLASMVMALNYGRISDLLGGLRSAAGAALVATGLGIVGSARSLTAVLLGMGCVGGGMGMIVPTIMLKITRKAPEGENARAVSVVTGALYFGQFASPLALALWGQVTGNTTIRYGFHTVATLFGAAAVVLAGMSLRSSDAD